MTARGTARGSASWSSAPCSNSRAAAATPAGKPEGRGTWWDEACGELGQVGGIGLVLKWGELDTHSRFFCGPSQMRVAEWVRNVCLMPRVRVTIPP